MTGMPLVFWGQQGWEGVWSAGTSRTSRVRLAFTLDAMLRRHSVTNKKNFVSKMTGMPLVFWGQQGWEGVWSAGTSRTSRVRLAFTLDAMLRRHSVTNKKNFVSKMTGMPLVFWGQLDWEGIQSQVSIHFGCYAKKALCKPINKLGKIIT